MIVTFRHGDLLVLEPTARHERYAATVAGESRLMYHLKKILNANGFDLIKKNPQKDGHLTSEPYYLRTRSMHSRYPHIYITDDRYDLRLLSEDFNNGGADLMIVHNVYNMQPGCINMVSELLREPLVSAPEMEWWE